MLYVAMGMVVLVGACLQGVGGIGFAMFSAPIAGLFFPGLAPGPLIVLGGSVSMLSVVREFAAIDWPVVGSALSGRALGTLVAAGLLATLPVNAISVLFAAMILGAVALSLAGWRVQATRGNVAVAGTVSGVMGTITSAGAPPLALVMQHMSPPRLRATVGCVFVAGAVMSVGMLTVVGRFDLPHLWLSASLLPWLAVGFAMSGRVGRRISPPGMRWLLLGLCVVGAVGILAKVAYLS